jgi:hypothetical protein
MFKTINNVKNELELKIFSGGQFATKKVNHQFNILYLNIQSLRNKLTQFATFVELSKTVYHVVVLAETHIKSDEKDFYNLIGYEVAHCIRQGNSFGGVSIFVKRDFSTFNVVHSLEFELNNSLLISLDRNNVKILGFYRYRQSNNQNFLNHLDELTSTHENLIIMGDFNIDLYNLETDSFISQYHDLILGNGFIFLNDLNEPTRICHRADNSSSSTLIDHLISDIPFTRSQYDFYTYIDEIFGDHKALLLSLNTHKPLPPQPSNTITIKRINHSKIKKDKLIARILTENFDDFQSKLQKIFLDHTSILVKRERFRKPFMNVKILVLMEIRQNYFRLTRRYPSCSKFRERFKLYRNLVTEKIREAKKKYYEKKFQCESSDAKLFWNNVKNLLMNRDKKPQSFCNSLNINNYKITNRQKIVEAFNGHFATVAEKIQRSIQIDPWQFDLIHSCERFDIRRPFEVDSFIATEKEFLGYLSGLKSSDAQDSLGFSNNIFKLHSQELAKPLANLTNKCLSSGIFPASLKVAKITPLYKNSGKRDNLDDYRPVAITSISSKVIEDFLLDKLSTHLANNNIINKNQFGFSKGCSTEVATTHVLNKIYNSKDQGLSTAALFIDLQKAFDSVKHDILLTKMKKLELPSVFVRFLESYFSNRTQYVQINEAKSPLLPILSGVFQGSKPAACLFILYINDIFSLPLHGTLFLYADDIVIVYGAKDSLVLKQQIENDLILLNCWLENHYLKMNLRKTKYIYFQGRAQFDSFLPDGLNITTNNLNIERVSQYEYLGILIDERLNFEPHILNLKSRITSLSFAFKRIRPYISFNTATQLYFQHVHSLLIYLNSCWNTAACSRLSLLATTQKRILRIIFQKPPLFPSRSLFSAKILPLEYLNEYQNLLLVYKMIKGHFRSNIQVSTRFEVSGIATRQSSLFDIQRKNSAIGKRDFFYIGYEMFNKLPVSVKSSQSVSIFKNNLRENLFNKFQQSAN